MDRSQRFRTVALTATDAAVTELRAAEANVETTVARALHWGASWAEIGDAIGVTRQSAHRRFRDLRWDPVTQTAWHEPQLPL